MAELYFSHIVETLSIQWQNVLGKNGYFTNVMHANNKSFWNRDIMYNALGIDKFYDLESYEIGEGRSG